jgi:predicted O-linked N-acetylglucosamine transferase (SPINDLY family)
MDSAERLQALLSSTILAHPRLEEINASTQNLVEEVRINLSRGVCSSNNPQQDQLSPTEVDQLLKDAAALVNSDYLAEAELILICLLLKQEQCHQAIAKLAQIYELQSNYQQTVLLTKNILARQGYNTEAAYQLAFALHKLGNSDEALEYIIPYYVSGPSQRVSRLCGILLKDLGSLSDAIDILEKAVENDCKDIYSARALSEIYVEAGIYQKALDTLHAVPSELIDATSTLYEAIIARFMGELNKSIKLHNELIARDQNANEALWAQCFNYSISDSSHSRDLLAAAKKYWSEFRHTDHKPIETTPTSQHCRPGRRPRIGFLTSDIGDHVVSRFLAPLLRSYNREEHEIVLLSTTRRYESMSIEIAAYADSAIDLQKLSLSEARSRLAAIDLDIIIDTNGFTKNSGLHILAERCASTQCHYIGYHATTGLDTIDYFLGDAVTTPASFQWQYIEELAQIPRLWLAYDSTIEFPLAIAKTERNSPVLGAFSQITKINTATLDYWSAAMRAVPDSILVIKDRGVQCQTSCKRIEDTMEGNGVNPDRIYFIAPVDTHFDHLDSYNAIDIALDTTPWSGATTAFEALGMGVPLVAICGDTTSGRMSTSVVSAAEMPHLVTKTPKQFATAVAELCEDYLVIRKNKADSQKKAREGILFDESRICTDFFSTINSIITGNI